MNGNDLLQTQWVDMVFEGRNKQYGSYFLRRVYQKHIMRALLIGGFSFSLGMFLPMIYAKVVDKGAAKVVIIDLGKDKIAKQEKKEEIKKPKEEKIKPKQVAKTIFVVPVVLRDKDVKNEEKHPIIDSTLFTKKISNVNKDGDLSSNNVKTIEETPIIEDKKVEEYDFPLDYVEQEATFGQGGKDEAVKWIQQHIVYPSIARENGLQGKVYITFVIDKKGKVSDVKIVKDVVGGGCGEEAARVIKSMPDWKPGFQNGNPVKVKVTLPISYKLEN